MIAFRVKHLELHAEARSGCAHEAGYELPVRPGAAFNGLARIQENDLRRRAGRTLRQRRRSGREIRAHAHAVRQHLSSVHVEDRAHRLLRFALRGESDGDSTRQPVFPDYSGHAGQWSGTVSGTFDHARSITRRNRVDNPLQRALPGLKRCRGALTSRRVVMVRRIEGRSRAWLRAS